MIHNLSPAKLAANRANALKSTGPKTPAGKRRVALNALKRNLCSKDFADELRRRGEDLGQFLTLHRDLRAVFDPKEPEACRAVEMLAQAWWEKARRIRAWVGAGPPRTDDLDARLEDALRYLVYVLRLRHQWWKRRLTSVIGPFIGAPEHVRRNLEAWLILFGARAGRRKYPKVPSREESMKDFEAFVKYLEQIKAARELKRAAAGRPNGGSGKQSQTNPTGEAPAVCVA